MADKTLPDPGTGLTHPVRPTRTHSTPLHSPPLPSADLPPPLARQPRRQRRAGGIPLPKVKYRQRSVGAPYPAEARPILTNGTLLTRCCASTNSPGYRRPWRTRPPEPRAPPLTPSVAPSGPLAGVLAAMHADLPKPAHLGRPGEWQDPRRPLATSCPARHERFPPTYFCAEHATQVARAPAFMVSWFHAYRFPCFGVFTVCLSMGCDRFPVTCCHVSPLPWFRVFMLPVFTHTPASGVPAIGQPGFPSLRFYVVSCPVPGSIYLP